MHSFYDRIGKEEPSALIEANRSSQGLQLVITKQFFWKSLLYLHDYKPGDLQVGRYQGHIWAQKVTVNQGRGKCGCVFLSSLVWGCEMDIFYIWKCWNMQYCRSNCNPVELSQLSTFGFHISSLVISCKEGIIRYNSNYHSFWKHCFELSVWLQIFICYILLLYCKVKTHSSSRNLILQHCGSYIYSLHIQLYLNDIFQNFFFFPPMAILLKISVLSQM